MKVRTRLLTQVLVLHFFVAGVASAGPPETDVAASGETSMRTALGKKTVEVTFHAAKIAKSDPRFPLDLDSYNEVSVVQRMRIIVDGHVVVVPRSAFMDLFNVRKASLSREKDLFVLSVGGADGADLYLVRIYFDSTAVRRRAAFDPTNQKQTVEETHYRKKLTIIE